MSIVQKYLSFNQFVYVFMYFNKQKPTWSNTQHANKQQSNETECSHN